MRRIFLVAALLFLGDCRRVNGSYCDPTTPCASAQRCDLVAHECAAGGAALGPDLAAPGDAAPREDLISPADLTAPADLTTVDLAASCTTMSCTQNAAGNAACKGACKTATAKCAANLHCTP